MIVDTNLMVLVLNTSCNKNSIDDWFALRPLFLDQGSSDEEDMPAGQALNGSLEGQGIGSTRFTKYIQKIIYSTQMMVTCHYHPKR